MVESDYRLHTLYTIMSAFDQDNIQLLRDIMSARTQNEPDRFSFTKLSARSLLNANHETQAKVIRGIFMPLYFYLIADIFAGIADGTLEGVGAINTFITRKSVQVLVETAKENLKYSGNIGDGFMDLLTTKVSEKSTGAKSKLALMKVNFTIYLVN